MYRHSCLPGEPDELVDQYMEQYNGIQSTYFSFLPTHSKTGYECLLGAIEMGYNVDGYMIVTHDTLINSWSFESLDPSRIWHGNQHAINVTSDQINLIDPEDKTIRKSTRGILKALSFLEEVLLKSPPARMMEDHLDHPGRNKRSGAESEDFPDTTGAGQTDSTDTYVAMDDDEMMSDEAMKSASVSEANNETAQLLYHNNWHISLFGEITQDEPGQVTDDLSDTLAPLINSEDAMGHQDHMNVSDVITPSSRNVSELLFHPANFVNEEGDSPSSG